MNRLGLSSIRRLLALFIFSPLLMFAEEFVDDACVLPCGYVSLSTYYWYHETHNFWNKNGDKRSSYSNFERKEFDGFIDYGVTDWDTLRVRGQWVRIEEDLDGRRMGFEEFQVSWKHYLCCYMGHHVSARLMAIIPAETDYKPPLRYGEYGGELSILASNNFTFCDRCGWYDLHLGYRAYSGFPSDQIRADVRAEYPLFWKINIAASGHLEYGLWNGRDKKNKSLIWLNSKYRLFKGRVEANMCLCDCASVTVGYTRHLWGRDVGTGGGVYTGIRFDY